MACFFLSGCDLFEMGFVWLGLALFGVFLGVDLDCFLFIWLAFLCIGLVLILDEGSDC